ncbi:hypothetical protein GCM10007140_23610 [Priestia taiwanensis]|uniref:Uncharacterized protein n=1 Tax=Priestia taiwanensis TaxID=1347902 RepID=A0A917EQT7_9BACI|nr:hypothetical protein GCM10007140_23610 [Priestia taiwanensis]
MPTYKSKIRIDNSCVRMVGNTNCSLYNYIHQFPFTCVEEREKWEKKVFYTIDRYVKIGG